jgi:hypothetical protein
MAYHIPNPTGRGGQVAGEPSRNPDGRPKSVNQIQLYALARCREAIDVATRVMQQPKEGDNMRLRAAELILTAAWAGRTRACPWT